MNITIHLRTSFFILLLLFVGATVVYGQTYNVTFRIDMSAEVISPNGVHIAGSFQSVAGLGNNWDPASTFVLDVNGDKIYEITVALPSGSYEYKFINGNAWGMDENPPSACSIGNNNNREATVTDVDLVLPAFPFNGCIPSVKLTVNMVDRIVSPEGVYVMGDFQVASGGAHNWDPSVIKLQDLNQDGTYEVELLIPYGTYQYVFVNGNTIVQVENLPDNCSSQNPGGLRVREVTFDTDDVDPETYCFGTCDLCHPFVVYRYETKWWNDAVFYEIFVRSFYDNTGDGIGDFKGLTQKLDYLNDGNPDTDEDLGITGIWLMPMMKSPSYHGYDVADYYATEPDYGSTKDFDEFIAAAHARGIKVIIDLVMNHSSNQNPWFIQSANNQNGYRDWYVWSDTDPGFNGPWGQDVWHPRNGDYYYGLFFDGMPDLNYKHEPLKDEMLNVVKFWLDRGVDGYRLDAIKYLVEEGTQLENTSGTYAFLEEFHDVYKAENPEAFTVGEVWSSTQSIIPYVQNDRLDVCFEFGLAGAILDAVDNSNPESLESQLETVLVSYPMLQYATFLTNHDMDRVFSQLNVSIDKMKLAASIYLTLPGVPFLYYGEEIGMTGTGDHLNIRRPMQWTNDTHAGFTTANPWQTVGSNYPANNVETMDNNPNSILNHYKKLISIRNAHQSLRKGQTLLLDDNTDDVFSFARVHQDSAILIVSNTGTVNEAPLLSLPISSLPAGEYFVTDLLKDQALGKITINESGGFSDLQIPAEQLSSRETWILLLSLENPVTSTEELIPQGQIRLTPNPANEYFQIERISNISGPAQLQIYSADGRMVYHQTMNSKKWMVQTSDWHAGVYIIQLSNGTETIVGKLILNL